MDASPITLTYLRNDPPPRGANQPPADDAPEYVRKHYPVAQIAKRAIEQRMHKEKHAADLRHRIEATQDQVQMRALHGFL